MLNAIIDLIARAYRGRLEARLSAETGAVLTDFAARMEASLNGGDLTAAALASPTTAPAVEDKPRPGRARAKA